MNHIDRIEQLRARVSELEAALRDAVGMLEELDGLDWGEEGMPFDVDFNHFAKVLARAESATPAKRCDDCAPEFGCWDGGEPCYKQLLVKSTPAKHPDTEIVDWLDAQFQSGDDWCRLFPLGNTIREAYAARKALAESATPLPMREDPRYRGTDFRSAIDVDRASQGGGK